MKQEELKEHKSKGLRARCKKPAVSLSKKSSKCTGSVKTDNGKETPYGRIKETTIRGIFMPREYRHIQEFEIEIILLKEQWSTNREVAEKLGFSLKQVKNLINRYKK